MKQVASFIKKFLFFLLLWGCVFQTILLFKNERLKEGEHMKADIKKQIDVLREDTTYIINLNPSVCTLIRDVPLKNEKGEIVSYERIRIENVIVRFSLSTYWQDDNTLVGSDENIRRFFLTAKHDADIKKGDVLKDEKDCYFKVRGITDMTFLKRDKEYCYKKSGWVLWLVT